MTLRPIRQLMHDEDGAALAEYALLIGLIAVVCILALKTLGTKLSDLFATVLDAWS